MSFAFTAALIEVVACPLIEPNPHLLVLVAGCFLLIGGSFAQARRITVHCISKCQHVLPAIVGRHIGGK